MDRHLEQAAAVETAFDGLSRRSRQVAAPGRDPQHAKCRLIAGKQDINVQRVSGRPVNQLFRSISPSQAEGGIQHGLGPGGSDGKPHSTENGYQSADEEAHGKRFRFFRRSRKPTGWSNGSVLVEITIAMTLLTVLGLTLLKLSLNITVPRQWTLQQSIADAYMTFEKATAQRLPLKDLTSDQSLWPAHPSVAVNTIELGKLPGGRPITGTVSRTRFADANNLATDGGSGTVASNPAGMEVWEFQSVVRYSVGGRNYLKSRTVVRSQ